MAIRRFGETTVYDNNFVPTTRIYTGENEFVGCCLELYTQTERIMSDVWDTGMYVRVWDGPADFRGKPVSVFIGYSYERVCLRYEHELDATSEIQACYAAWKLGKQIGDNFAYAERGYDSREHDGYLMRHNPAVKGRIVKVVRGRKVPIGTQGMVFWIGLDNYNNQKLGIATSDREDDYGRFIDVVWTASKNCVPVNPRDGKA